MTFDDTLCMNHGSTTKSTTNASSSSCIEVMSARHGVGFIPPMNGRVRHLSKSNHDIYENGVFTGSHENDMCGGGSPHCEYTLLKRWMTGEKATLEDEDIQMQIFDLAREWMNASFLFKLHEDVEGERDIASENNSGNISRETG